MNIKGLSYIPGYISADQQEFLVKQIDSQEWSAELARRTQHYGYIYDYQTKKASLSTYLGELPDWLSHLARQLYQKQLIPYLPDQAIINEYEPGQGIALHIDCLPCFDDTIAVLSLLSPLVMDFRYKEEHIPLMLEPGSLLILKDEARLLWKHGIAKRKTDRFNGLTFQRKRRVSITFRKVVI